jgi:hypothetical protein
VRDGRDCVASLKAMPWFTQDVHAAISTWVEAIGSCRRAARTLPADAYYELRYERLVASPAAELAALCEFLGEDFDPVMTEPHKIADIALPKRQVWHAETHKRVTTARTGSWQDRLEPWEIALCEAIMGSRLRAFGYELSGAPRPSPGQLARYVRVDALRRAAAHKRHIRDTWERSRESGPLECQL